ncbi:prefoldin subunit 5 [Hemiscyllium ocellatum]|uniref:prefoldin subunit 5 n=1 Tax=Hemiscyllium ocellatum TaxID=170820 RepID=UPI0029667D01|nr:prefoldin subunit 5 [Hemiscyllium ocellatum]
MAQAVNVSELPLQQLETLRSQLEQETEFLTTSIQQLKLVQSKYVESKECVNKLSKDNAGKDVLVPLTSSMYVPGKLEDVQHVLVDVGTGYYVEKDVGEARDFFTRKVEFLTKQIEKVQPALQEKYTMKQAVIEMLNQRIQHMAALNTSQTGTSKA